MNTVAIVDYGMCNLDSVRRAVEECGARPMITEDARELATATRIILPGVGAFPDGIRHLRERHLDEALSEQVLGRHTPFLGICLGMQMLAVTGQEGHESAGLGWIDADVRRLQPVNGERVPHVGWNEVERIRDCPIFRGIPSGNDFYFVHSYHVDCRDPNDVVGRTPYSGGFVAAVQREHIFGVQFHLEKSQRPGLHVLRNFLSL